MFYKKEVIGDMTHEQVNPMLKLYDLCVPT
jgi:hypothetical protein